MSFFFSSRRRHTRWNCDWSSDVCSSDLLHFVKMVGNVGQKSGRHIHLLIAVNGPYHAERQKKFFFGSGYRHVKQSSFFFVPFLVPVAESAVRKQSFFQSDNENIFEFQTLGGVNRHQPDTVFFFPLPAGRLVHRVLSAHQNGRSEERRVGKEGRSRGSPYH